MLGSKWKRAMLGIASIGMLSVAANAELDNAWVGPSSLDCLFAFCWREGQWETGSNWNHGHIPSSNETPVFKKNNHSNSCPQEDGSEDWLQVNLTNDHTVHAVRIEVTLGSGNKLYIALVGSNTITCTGHVTIKATNGPILFEVADGARVKTD